LAPKFEQVVDVRSALESLPARARRDTTSPAAGHGRRGQSLKCDEDAGWFAGFQTKRPTIRINESTKNKRLECFHETWNCFSDALDGCGEEA
jgi:hypothetical protein